MEAEVKYPGETRKVVMGEKGVKVGDYVLVQMGIIVKKISQDEADSAMRAWGEMSPERNLNP